MRYSGPAPGRKEGNQQALILGVILLWADILLPLLIAREYCLGKYYDTTDVVVGTAQNESVMDAIMPDNLAIM
jgi:hypothetical protein